MEITNILMGAGLICGLVSLTIGVFNSDIYGLSFGGFIMLFLMLYSINSKIRN